MDKKEDLRITKTKKVLYETLLTLLADKSFEELKVSDICETALVNRSTFYAHFGDKYELLASYIDELKNALLNELNKNENITNTKDYYLKMIDIFLEYLSSRKEIYRKIMTKNRNNIVMDMIYSSFKKDIEKNIEKIKTDKQEHIPSSFISQFYLGAISGICMGLIENPNKYSIQDIMMYLDKLIPNNLYY